MYHYFTTDCSLGFYGRFCNISCAPGLFGRSCAGNCTPICSLDKCDPVYGCKSTTENLIRPTSSGIKYLLKIMIQKGYYFSYTIVPASLSLR